jgi:hypothetical protein
MTYTGHEQGQREHDAVVHAFAQLPADTWIATRTTLLNRKDAPNLLCTWKR